MRVRVVGRRNRKRGREASLEGPDADCRPRSIHPKTHQRGARPTRIHRHRDESLAVRLSQTEWKTGPSRATFAAGNESERTAAALLRAVQSETVTVTVTVTRDRHAL